MARKKSSSNHLSFHAPATQASSTTGTPDNPTLYKILVIGNSTSGKSKYIDRCIGDEHSSPEDFLPKTIGIDFTVRYLDVNDQHIKLQIWDTAGQERFKKITASYYTDAKAIIIACNLNDTDSIESIKKWHKQMREYNQSDVAFNIIGTVSEEMHGEYPGKNLAQMQTIAGELNTRAFVIDFSKTVSEDPMLDLIGQMQELEKAPSPRPSFS